MMVWMKPAPTQKDPLTRWLLPAAWIAVILLAYGRLLVHPDLHIACPENDTWNLPIRWSVLSSLRQGILPLWNPLSAFGIPWLATWQTETFYPGTLCFKIFGLNFWNYSGILHLLILSLGLYRLLRNAGVETFWSFFCSAIALLNGCAYNHLGSNSSMDTMAWAPWLLVAVQNMARQKKAGSFQFAAFLALQIFAGYPQIIFYSIVAAAAYGVFLSGWKFPLQFFFPLLSGLILSACQWLPSVEYFFLNSVRFPAVQNNPGFFLPLENLKTFLHFNVLWQNNIPDYVASPTFFYFNFYSGFIPLMVLILGMARWNKLKTETRFFLAGFLLFLIWALGWPAMLGNALHLPLPAFLEPAKCWVLLNVLELAALGLIGKDLFPKPGAWKWAVLMIALADLLYAVWTRPLERNFFPPHPLLAQESAKIKDNLEQGRVLILPDAQRHQEVYTPLPSHDGKPLFKHFVPNSNLFVSLPVANFYGSTWPSWGSLDAQFYFFRGFPYLRGTLMDFLGVDLLLLTGGNLAPPYEKIFQDPPWTLWKNPRSLGSHFFFFGNPQEGSRKEAFQAFADGANPLQTLYLDASFVSEPSLHQPSLLDPSKILFNLPRDRKGFLVMAQNAMPGWRAWIDGKETEIRQADGIFQCVSFPEGSRTAHLQYEPASFRLGLFLSLASWMMLLSFGGIKKES